MNHQHRRRPARLLAGNKSLPHHEIQHGLLIMKRKANLLANLLRRAGKILNVARLQRRRVEAVATAETGRRSEQNVCAVVNNTHRRDSCAAKAAGEKKRKRREREGTKFSQQNTSYLPRIRSPFLALFPNRQTISRSVHQNITKYYYHHLTD